MVKINEEKIPKKRGRPKGSKNKPKDGIIEQTITQQEFEYGVDGVRLNERNIPLRDVVAPYVFIASACGCKITKTVRGSGMWCKHKNEMKLQK